MAYDEAVAERVRSVLKRRRGISERKMFGGIAFMLKSMVYVGPAGYRSDEDLRAWVERAVDYVKTLPPK